MRLPTFEAGEILAEVLSTLDIQCIIVDACLEFSPGFDCSILLNQVVGKMSTVDKPASLKKPRTSILRNWKLAVIQSSSLLLLLRPTFVVGTSGRSCDSCWHGSQFTILFKHSSGKTFAHLKTNSRAQFDISAFLLILFQSLHQLRLS
ncbi:hypothetical protein AC1031_005088 [Aphanomyces cochlioides]|nr:hypothetical protein AC1031_005088 [Aphanomyces cochlioides]